jgi:hypothetical protein
LSRRTADSAIRFALEKIVEAGGSSSFSWVLRLDCE